MQLTDLGPLAQETWHALQAHYGPAINHTATGFGIPLGEWYGWLMAARIFEPDPVSAETLGRRSAYTSPTVLEGHLAGGARLGLLRVVADGEYRLTDAGHAAVAKLIASAYAAMAPLTPLPVPDLERLAGLLSRLVQASLAAPEPPDKWCLRIARHYDPGATAPVLVRIDQYLSDLDAYRDDAHLAAWHAYHVSGPAWETLTVLWRIGPMTVEQLQGKLARRGFSVEAYATALQELVGRGWVMAEGDIYRPTEMGRAARAEAEANTNGAFYAPWSALSQAEQAELQDLLARLRDTLRRLSIPGHRP
jgi:DNA-binding MarR family transcriptional regulator